jgi:hypothetical protein
VIADLRVRDQVCPALLPALHDEIIAHSHGPSYGSKNVGGWKSTEDLFVWQDAPALRELGRVLCHDVPEIAELVLGPPHGRALPMVGWAMVNRNGSFHRRHCHGGKLVGVYYVTSGDPAVPTIIETPGGDMMVQPTPGRLAIFPPAFWHSVPVYEGQAPRITIAIEVRSQ